MTAQLHIDLAASSTAALVTVCMYIAFLIISRLVGARGLTNVSAFDFAALAAIGAVIGRTALLEVPTLTAGVTVLLTLFAVRVLVASASSRPLIDRLVNGRPIPLIYHGALVSGGLRQAHLHEQDLRLALRRAGTRSVEDVELAVRERDGSITVIPRGRRRVDGWVMTDLRGLAY